MSSLVHQDAVVNEKAGQKSGAREGRHNSMAATVSVVYLLILLAFFFWTLFDTWVGKNSIASWIGYIIKELETEDAGVYRLVSLTVMGGALGGIINGLRSFLQHGHSFDTRFVWKYITIPWLGATNALFVFALINSGLAVFGGSGATTGTDLSQIVAMFSVGVLAGYGSQDVFLWLDAQVTKLFSYEVMVPNLRNKSEEEAEEILRKARLLLGDVTEKERDGTPRAGKVTGQEPAAGSMLNRGGAVKITLAIAPPLMAVADGRLKNAPAADELAANREDQLPGPIG